MAILVTGGAGFIGSHTCVELLNAGEDIVVMDNFYNSNSRALDGIRKITGKDFKFYEDDMLDIAAVDQIFAENDIEQVIHFAGYKCVPESVQKPLMYYSNNLRGTFNILETMKKYGCTKFVFSSSATVYGIPATVPCRTARNTPCVWGNSRRPCPYLPCPRPRVRNQRLSPCNGSTYETEAYLPAPRKRPLRRSSSMFPCPPCRHVCL